MVSIPIPYEDVIYKTIAPADPTVDAQVVAAIRLQVVSGLAKAKHIGSGSSSDPDYAWEIDADDNVTRLKEPASGSGVTNLAVASITATTLDVTSDTGTDATIPAATTSLAGLLTGADKTLVNTISSKIAAANLTVGNIGASTLEVQSDVGTNATIPAATTSAAGLLTAADKTIIDNFSSAANLSLGTITPTTVQVLIDVGTDVTLPAATTDDAGLMTAAQFDSVATIASKLESVDLAIGAVSGTTVEITSDAGTNATIPAVVAGATAGVMTASQATTLSTALQAANLALGTHDATSLAVNIDTGTDVTIPAATTSLAGLMSAADKATLDTGLTNTNITTGTVAAATANRSIDLGSNDLDFVNVTDFTTDSPMTADTFSGQSLILKQGANMVTLSTDASLAVSYSLSVPLDLPTAGEVASGDNYVRVNDSGLMYYGSGSGGGGGSDTHSNVATIVARDALSPSITGFTAFVSENQTTYQWNGADWDTVGARASGTATERAALTNVEDNYIWDDTTDGVAYYYDSSENPSWIEL